MGVMRRFGCEVRAADVSESVVRAYEHFGPRGFGVVARKLGGRVEEAELVGEPAGAR